MKDRITKLATAAVVALAIGIGFAVLVQNGVQVAYALEQTIDAYHAIEFLHVKGFKDGEDEPKEFWVEVDDKGQVKKARVHMPAWDSPADGAKMIVWQDNKAQIWLKKKNILATIKDTTLAKHMREMIEQCNPALMVDQLYEEETRGRVEIAIDHPKSVAEPITVTATLLPDRSSRRVFFVDQATLLVTSMEHYTLVDDEYQYESEMEFYDYNHPIRAEIFTLQDIPGDAHTTVIDQTAQEVGLLKGDMTETEVCSEVARQFFEALIARNYAKAGQLYSGIPAQKMQQMFQSLTVLQIISLGEPKPYPNPRVGGYVVPYNIEIEKDGVTFIHEGPNPLAIRQVHGQPERWNIHGGI